MARRSLLPSPLLACSVLVDSAGLCTEARTRAEGPVATCCHPAVIGGLTTSMILTLMLTPVFYATVDDFGLWTAAIGRRARWVAAGRPRQPRQVS